MTDLIIQSDNALSTADHANASTIYLASLQSANAKRTMTNQLNTIARLLGYESHALVQWHLLKASHIAALKSTMLSTSSAATVNLRLSALRGVLKAAWRHGLLDTDTYMRLKDIENAKVNSVKAVTGRSLTTNELNKLIRSCINGTFLGLRDATIIATAYYGGLRREEIVSLNVENVTKNDKGNYQVIVKGKGNKTRTIYLTDSAAKLMHDYLNQRGTIGGALFTRLSSNSTIHTGTRLSSQAIYKMLASRAAKSNIASFSPHDLRRTTISHHLDAGTDIALVAETVGHANINTTRRYDRRGEHAKEQASHNLKLSY